VTRPAPIWTPPFEPSLERALEWFRAHATDSVLYEIADADFDYDPQVDQCLRDYLQSGNAMVVRGSNIYECCELVSHGDLVKDSTLVLIGGAVSVLLAFADEQYEPVPGTKNIARTMHGAIELGDGAIEAMLDVLAWCAVRQASGEWEAPASLLFAASLCGASVLAVEYAKTGRARAGFEWISASVCEALAPQLESLVEADVAYEPPLMGTHEWLVSLDEFQEGPPWWALTRATLERQDDSMPAVRALLERIMADCPTWPDR